MPLKIDVFERNDFFSDYASVKIPSGHDSDTSVLVENTDQSALVKFKRNLIGNLRRVFSISPPVGEEYCVTSPKSVCVGGYTD